MNNAGYENSDCTKNGFRYSKHCDDINPAHAGCSNFVKPNMVSSGNNADSATADQGGPCNPGTWGTTKCYAAGADFAGNSAATGAPFTAPFRVK